MLGWNHMSNLYNKHLALESFLPAFLYTNTESGWLQISGTQIGFFRHEQKIEKIKQAPTVYQILLYTSNTLSIGNPVRSFSWWGSAWIFIKIVISWPWPGVCEICKNFSNVLSIAYTNDSRVMWHLLAFNMFSCSQCHEFGKCRFFLGGDRLWHTQVYVLLPDEQKRHLHQHHGVKLLEDPAEESAWKALRGAIFGGTWNDGVNKSIEMAPLSKIVQIFLTWGLSILQILTMLPLNCHYPLNIKKCLKMGTVVNCKKGGMLLSNMGSCCKTIFLKVVTAFQSCNNYNSGWWLPPIWKILVKIHHVSR